jgi:putative spermidine/putrescine transport system permease protein
MTLKSRLARILFGAVVLAIAAFLLLPTLIIFPISFSAAYDASQFPPAAYSFKWYESVLTDPAWQSATITSLKASCLTVICSVALGTSAALALFRGRFAGKAVVRALLLSPLVTPVVVFAIGIFMVFSSWRVVGTLWGLVAANTVLSTPFVVASVTATLHTLNPNLELASAGLGAGPWRTFWRITLPLIFPGVMAGAIFAFIASWDEVVVAIFLTTPSLRTLPVLIWSGVRAEISPAVAAVGSILIVISAIGMIAVYLITKGDSR